MRPLSFISANWQTWLPALAVIGGVLWLIAFRTDPGSERALFAALLVIYMLHQTEEHLWPGGFRQFANAHVFKSGNDDWPVDKGGVALVNIGLVWLPVALAALFPDWLRWLGLGWIGVTLINAMIHIVASIRLRIYNPGLVTSIVLFLPFTIWMLAREVSGGALSGLQIVMILVLGILLHIPVAALFVVPFLRARDKTRSTQADDANGHRSSYISGMTNVRQNPALSRFELDVDGHIAFASYRQAGDVLMMTHTETPPALRERGIGERLVLGALEQVRAQGLKVRPSCSFVRFVLSKHPEFQDLVA